MSRDDDARADFLTLVMPLTARAGMTNGLANCAAARSAPDLTSRRRSMPARQLDFGKLLSLVRTTCSGSRTARPPDASAVC